MRITTCACKVFFPFLSLCTEVLCEAAQLESPCSAERQRGALILNPVGGAAQGESAADGCEIHLCLVPLESRKVTQLSGSKIQYLNLSSMSLSSVSPVTATQSLPDASLTGRPIATPTARRCNNPHPP